MHGETRYRPPARASADRAGGEHTAKRPGLLLVAMAIASFVVCVASFASRQIDLGVGAASVSLLAAGASLAWRSAEARRVRQIQRESDRARSIAR